MGTIFSILLDILAILAIIVFGAFIIVVVADLVPATLLGKTIGVLGDKVKTQDEKMSIVLIYLVVIFLIIQNVFIKRFCGSLYFHI